MNSESLDEKSNNYIGCILDVNYAYIISYTDLSTGEFNATIISHDSTRLIMDVLSLSLNEIVVKSNFDKNIIDILKNKHRLNISIFDEDLDTSLYKNIYSSLSDDKYIESVKYLLSYLISTQKRDLSHLQVVRVKDNSTYLKMDINTIFKHS